MTFNYLAAKKVFYCKTLIDNVKPSALDIGAQTVTINSKFVEKLFTNIDLKKITEKANYHYNLILNQDEFSVKDFYFASGFKDYHSIDINGAYESYKFDLNQNIEKTYNFNEQFDLVINNGTGEHVFNQHSLFENMHNLTKENGLILNILPFIGWINHGFYNYNPLLFADLAASNNYEVINMSIANRDGNELSINNKNQYGIYYEQIKPKRFNELRKFISICNEKLGENLIIISILKKNSNSSFKSPLQGKYLQDIQDNPTLYSNQTEGSSKAEGQINDNNKRRFKR